MARTSVNFVVGAGSAATLAASLAGIAQADGYAVPLPMIGGDQPPPVAGVVSSDPPIIEPASSPASPAAEVPLTAAAVDLPPLPPLELGPGRAVQIAPMPQVSVEATGALNLGGNRGSVDVSGFVPTPAPSQPSVAVTAPSAPPPPAAAVPAPTVVAAPPPPPAPPPPTSTTKAS